MTLICDVRTDQRWERLRLPNVIPGDTIVILDDHGEVIRITIEPSGLRTWLHDALKDLQVGLRPWVRRPA